MIILRVFGLISIVIFELCIAKEFTLPVTTCHRDSADYSICLRDAMQEAWPRFVQGLSQFQFPRLDPFFYKNINFVINNSIINMNIEISNASATGAMNAYFSSVQMDFVDDVFHMEVDMTLPETIREAIFKIEGIMGPFRLNNTGYLNASATNLKEKWNLTGHVTNDRLIMDHFRIVPIITDMEMEVYFKGFLNNEKLEKLLNEFVNKHWRILYKFSRNNFMSESILMDKLEPWLLEIINNLFSNVSFSKVFPK